MKRITLDSLAPMGYLDDTLKYYKTHAYAHERERRYVEALCRIRDIQRKGIIPKDEDYIAVGGEAYGVEYGFWCANIQPYLHEWISEFEISPEYQDAINKRLLFFFDDNADLSSCSCSYWLTVNFPPSYHRFLELMHGLPHHRFRNDAFSFHRLNRFVKRCGNEDEKRVVALYGLTLKKMKKQ